MRRFLARFIREDFYAKSGRALRNYCTDSCSDFPQTFLRRSGALRRGGPESRKNLHKIGWKICSVPMACPQVGSPFHLREKQNEEGETRMGKGEACAAEEEAKKGLQSERGSLAPILVAAWLAVAFRKLAYSFPVPSISLS